MPGMPKRRAKKLAQQAAMRELQAKLAAANAKLGLLNGEAPPPPPSIPTKATSRDILSQAPPEKMRELVDLALLRAKEILSTRLDPRSPDFIKLAALQQSTLNSILGTQTRTDPGQLKGRPSDSIGEILEAIRTSGTPASSPSEPPAADRTPAGSDELPSPRPPTTLQ